MTPPAGSDGRPGPRSRSTAAARDVDRLADGHRHAAVVALAPAEVEHAAGDQRRAAVGGDVADADDDQPPAAGRRSRARRASPRPSSSTRSRQRRACPSTARRRRRGAGRARSPRGCRRRTRRRRRRRCLQPADDCVGRRGHAAVPGSCKRRAPSAWRPLVRRPATATTGRPPSARPLVVGAGGRDRLLHVADQARLRRRSRCRRRRALAAKNRTHSCRKPIAGPGAPLLGTGVAPRTDQPAHRRRDVLDDAQDHVAVAVAPAADREHRAADRARSRSHAEP